MFFRGRSFRSLDLKGRLMLTPEFRSIVTFRSPEGKLILTTYDGCIVGFPFPEWREFEMQLTAIPNPSRNIRNFRRLVLGGAEEVALDSQGRVRLSKEHLHYSGIAKEAILMGQGTRIELWSPERLDAVLEQDFADVAQDMIDSGIDFGF